MLNYQRVKKTTKISKVDPKVLRPMSFRGELVFVALGRLDRSVTIFVVLEYTSWFSNV